MDKALGVSCWRASHRCGIVVRESEEWRVLGVAVGTWLNASGQEASRITYNDNTPGNFHRCVCDGKSHRDSSTVVMC